MILALAAVLGALWLAGFSGQGLFTLTGLLWAPVGIVFIWVNSWLFPLEVDLLALPADPVEPGEADPLDDPDLEWREDSDPVPAPWAPRFHTIEPPTTFAGVAITVLMIVVFAYNGWVALDAVVARFMAPRADATISTGNLPIRAELDDDAITVTNGSDVLWNCTLTIPLAGTTVVTAVQVPPMQTRRVGYGAFWSGPAPLTPKQVRTFAGEHLSGTCEDPRGTVRVGNLR